MLHSWAIFNGVELANNRRVMDYLQNGYGPSSMQVRPDCGCQHTPLLGPEEYHGPYVNPVTDSAPWWSPDDHLSDEFAGFYLEKVTGFDSTLVDRAIGQNVGQGGTIGPARYGPRRLKFTGWLYGRTCGGVEWGLDWLDSVVSGRTCNTSNQDTCGKGQLTMAAFCIDNDPAFCGPFTSEELEALQDPDDVLAETDKAYVVGDAINIGNNSGEDWRGVARTMCSVAQTQGIKVIQKRGSCCSSCGCTQYKVEFELTSEQPYMHEPVRWCWNRPRGLRFPNDVYPIEFFCCENRKNVLATYSSEELSELVEGLTASSFPPPFPIDFLCLSTHIPDCGYIDAPKPRPQGSRCFCEPWGTKRRCCTLENRSKVSTDSLVFKLLNDSNRTARNIRISVYEWEGMNWDLNGEWEDLDDGNIFPDPWTRPDCPGCPTAGVDPDGNTYADMTLAWECCHRIASYEITEVPPLSTLEIDGTCQKITLDWMGQEIRNGSGLVSGDQGTPFKWVEQKPCSRLCIVAYADCDFGPNQLRFAVGQARQHAVGC